MPITSHMRAILVAAREYGASDIHVVAGLPPTFRVHGEILLGKVPPLSREETRQLTYEVLSEEQRRAFEADWQLCCSLVDDELGRFRVSVYYHGSVPEMSIRPVVPHIRTREELGLPDILQEFCRLPHGLILITGPTGSGKTTTMNYMIDFINSDRRCKVITIEDPVEFVHERKKAIIVQQELHLDVKSFNAALIHVLRQNPDVISVGEMRDFETTATAVTAAETGHLVIATCHTPNAMQTIDRVVSVFPPAQQGLIVAQLSTSLRGVIAQRLVPTAEQNARVLACEVLTMNPAARVCIREHHNERLPNVIQTGRKDGMISMDESLVRLYLEGRITYDTCLSHAADPQGVKGRIHRKSSS